MVSGELDGAELARRLEPFGLRDRAAVLVLTPPRRAEGGDRGRAGARAARRGAGRPGRRHRPLLVRAAGAHARRRRRGAVRARRAPARARLRGGRLRPRGRRGPHGARRRAAARVPRGALRARGARAGRTNGDAAGLATYRDLGSFQLLLSLQDDEALRLFCDSILAPIEEGEGAYGGELMRSLEAFIECNGQWERAARQLYCHRHTLRYRIRRVEELTGRSLDSARDRIDFWLALRGRELTTKGEPRDRWRSHRDQDRRVPSRADPGRRARAGRARPRGRGPGGRGRGLGDLGRRLPVAGRADPPGRRGRVRRGGHDRQGQGAPAAPRSPSSRRATCCSPTCTWRPTPTSRAGSSSRARPASPTRPSRTRAGGCRCWRR